MRAVQSWTVREKTKKQATSLGLAMGWAIFLVTTTTTALRKKDETVDQLQRQGVGARNFNRPLAPVTEMAAARRAGTDVGGVEAPAALEKAKDWRVMETGWRRKKMGLKREACQFSIAAKCRTGSPGPLTLRETARIARMMVARKIPR